MAKRVSWAKRVCQLVAHGVCVEGLRALSMSCMGAGALAERRRKGGAICKHVQARGPKGSQEVSSAPWPAFTPDAADDAK